MDRGLGEDEAADHRLDRFEPEDDVAAARARELAAPGDLCRLTRVGDGAREQPLCLRPQIRDRWQAPGRVAAEVGEAHGRSVSPARRGRG